MCHFKLGDPPQKILYYNNSVIFIIPSVLYLFINDDNN